jgi:hypothetical protein
MSSVAFRGIPLHCAVDPFVLTDRGWKIAARTNTSRTGECSMSIRMERKLIKEIIFLLYHPDEVEVTSRIDKICGKQHIIQFRFLEQLVDFGAVSSFHPNDVAYWVTPNAEGYEIRINVGFLEAFLKRQADGPLRTSAW